MAYILLHVHRHGQGAHYEAIGTFATHAEVAEFLANPVVGDRGWIKVEVQTPEDVIKYFESRQ